MYLITIIIINYSNINQAGIKNNVKVAQAAFEVVEVILDEYYGYLKDNYYEDVIVCLITFANCKYSECINF